MKRLFTSLFIALLTLTAAMAQTLPLEQLNRGCFNDKVVRGLEVQADKGIHKAMPVYSSDLITEAPAGKVVSGCKRSGFSYYYSNGSLNGGYNDGFVGEYVIGDDGCIYIKDACASLSAGTYLKLDKIDNENYVAHTAQLIYVYDSGETVYTYFATRLVFTKYSDTSFGYAMEVDGNGKELCDVYFTYKDGVLKQKDQTIETLNGISYPHELIGFTTSTGGWIGYGDACLTFESATLHGNVLPEGAVLKDGSFSYCTMSSTTGQNVTNAQLTKYAEVGDTFYMLNPTDGKNWIVGDIDREAKTVTFEPQYIGVNESIGCHQWFKPATYKDWRDVWDEEDDFGTWVRDFTSCATYVCKYENGNVISDPNSKQTLVISLSDAELQVSGAYSEFCVKAYEPKLVKPAKPSLIKFSPVEETFFFGEIIFALPPVDENGVYINTDELYYSIYLNSTEPFLFSTKEFEKIPNDMTEIPYKYDDDYEFDCNGAFHNVYFYTEGIKYMGIQTIHRVGTQEMRSEIEWWGNPPLGISGLKNETEVNAVKMLKEGRVVICKDGVMYKLNGQKLR